MKKISALLLVLAMVLCLTACQAKEIPNTPQITTPTPETQATTVANDTQEATTEAVVGVTTQAPETEAPVTDAPETEATTEATTIVTTEATTQTATEATTEATTVTTPKPATQTTTTKNDPAKKLYGTWEGKRDLGNAAVEYVKQELGLESLEPHSGMVSFTASFESYGKVIFNYNAKEFANLVAEIVSTKECIDHFIDISAKASNTTRQQFETMMKYVTNDLYGYFAELLVESYTDPEVIAVFSAMLIETCDYELEGNTLCISTHEGHADYEVKLNGNKLTLTSDYETLKLTKK